MKKVERRDSSEVVRAHPLHFAAQASLLACHPAVRPPMLAPRASNAFVCVRCQLKQLRPSLHSLARRPSQAQFSSTTFRRDAFDEFEQASAPQRKPPPPKVSAHPLGKLQKRRGKTAVRASTAQLEGVKTLGKDAEILVLREVEDAPMRRSIPEPEVVQEVSQDTEMSAAKLLESIKEEGGQMTAEEVDQQLDSLRPKTHDYSDEPHYLTLEAFKSLSRALNQGFTAPQLAHYAVNGETVLPKTTPDKQTTPDDQGKQLVERTPWFPGRTPMNRRLPGTSAHQITARQKTKKAPIIDHIVRHKWGVVLLEEIESPGEIELHMTSWQLHLLNVNVGGML